MSKRNAHLKRAHDIEAQILQLVDYDRDNPKLVELIEQLRLFAKHHQLSAFAEVHERVSGLYGFESNGYEI